MKPFAKLRGRIVEIFGSQRRFAEEVGKSEVTIVSKLSGKMSFTMTDVQEWSRLLQIPLEEIGAYFFNEDLRNDRE